MFFVFSKATLSVCLLSADRLSRCTHGICSNFVVAEEKTSTEEDNRRGSEVGVSDGGCGHGQWRRQPTCPAAREEKGR